MENYIASKNPKFEWLKTNVLFPAIALFVIVGSAIYFYRLSLPLRIQNMFEKPITIESAGYFKAKDFVDAEGHAIKSQQDECYLAPGATIGLVKLYIDLKATNDALGLYEVTNNRPKTPTYHDQELGDLSYCNAEHFYFNADGHYIKGNIKHAKVLKTANALWGVIQSYISD